LSIAFADLDNFKSINDRYGHQAGDRILQATARILRSNTRETDMIARYGGEEFVVVLPATDANTPRTRAAFSLQSTVSKPKSTLGVSLIVAHCSRLAPA